MTLEEADALAGEVRSESGCPAKSLRDVDSAQSGYVEVSTPSGAYFIYEEADWQWLRPRITGGT